MKQKIAALLALCLCLQVCLYGSPVVYANTSESNHTTNTSKENVKVEHFENDNKQHVEKEQPVENVQVQGKLVVELIAGTNLSDEVNLDIIVKSNTNESNVSKESVRLGSYEMENNKQQVVFSGLQSGQYTLYVNGKAFYDYEQAVTISNDIQSYVKIYVGSYPTLTDKKLHPGYLEYRKYNNEDLQAILDEMDGTSNTKEYNLNASQDNEVNLLDLQHFSNRYELENYNYQAITSIVEKNVVSEVINASKADHTLVEGTLQDILNKGNTGVVLKTQSQAPISEENPIEVSFEFKDTVEQVLVEGMVISPKPGSTHTITSGTIVLETVNASNEIETLEIQINQPKMRLFHRSKANATIANDGSIVVDFNGQVAVKKVTLKVTGNKSNSNLVDISSVEFVNDMEHKIPAPELNIPTSVTAIPGSKEFTVSWDKQRNVTGYEVEVELDGAKQLYKTRSNKITISQFKNEKLLNGKTYKVKVQSTNEDWRSGYSNEIFVTPKADKIPPAPDNVTAKGSYRSIVVSWNDMKDTDSYHIYLRKESESQFNKVGSTDKTSYRIEGLEDDTKYILYVTGVNELGEGPRSLEAAVATVTITPTKLPEYKVINASNGEGKLTKHITSAQRTTGFMVDSVLDAEGTKDANGLVDNNYKSYYQLNDWDEAVNYHQWQWGLKVTLDQQFQMDRFSIGVPTNDMELLQAAVYYYDATQNKEVKADVVSFVRKHDDEGRNYYTIKLKNPIQTNKVRFGFAVSSYRRVIQVSEIRFYEYDSLEADILNLYKDSLHLTLKESVNEATIEALQTRLDTKHNDEYHPDQANLQKELDAAKVLLKEQQQLQEVQSIHTTITTAKDGHLGITGLNAWQPLGISAHEGEEIILYVGKEGAASGENTNLQLVATQQHAEVDQVSRVVATLRTGRNEITIPKLTDTNVEHGGALYIQYTGNQNNESYGVRVRGGMKVPTLDLYKVDANQRMELAKQYVKELETYVSQIESNHETLHKNGVDAVNHAYDIKTCIYNITDIMLDQMMISIPATQALAGLKTGSIEEKATRLLNSMEAMNQIMILYYQHKGLTDQFAEGTAQNVIQRNALPSRHLNIRYAKMFAGAFMYASGNHIGIEWNETSGMMQGTPAHLDNQGNITGGELFGWGIGHEIGHEINQAQYAVAEVTNNYFAQLSMFHQRGVRFDYDKVYERVTSNVEGRSGDVFLQLAMYWQLRLAYDNGYTLQTYNDYNEIMDHIFFARVDSFARTPDTAPAPNGVRLSLTNDEAQNIIRLASAAAQKNLKEFFRRWGLIANQATLEYIQQFDEESRAIYYVNDELQAYRRSTANGNTFIGKDIVSASTEYTNGSRVTLNLSATAQSEDLFGYEISRVTYHQGQPKEEVVGFTKTNQFVDNVAHLGNRVVTYKVKAIDKYLNASNVVTLEAIKVEGDGLQDKSDWSILSNENSLVSDADMIEQPDVNDPCEPNKVLANTKMIDGKLDTIYHGKTEKTNAEFIIDFGKTTEVTSIRYYAGNDKSKAIRDYSILISDNNKEYKEIKSGTFELDSNGVATLFFDNGTDPWIANYEARYLKVIAKNQKEIKVAELDVLGPTGDNVEFITTEDQAAVIGTLKTDFVYQEATNGQEELKIPAGSIIFTGKYKGNPAYNVVVAYNELGEIITGSDQEANQIILAPDPQDAMLGETSEGRFVYWIDANAQLPKQVRMELYRVNNAITNEGQRLVSDTKFVDIPTSLPQIELKK